MELIKSARALYRDNGPLRVNFSGGVRGEEYPPTVIKNVKKKKKMRGSLFSSRGILGGL